MPEHESKPLVLRVVGTPAPKGSGRAMVTKAGQAVHVPSGSSANAKAIASWGTRVIEAFQAAQSDGHQFQPLAVGIVFQFPLRKGDLDSKGRVKAAAPVFPTSKRDDIDKLCRSTLDALTEAGAWGDDSQVVMLSACKVYVPPGHPVGATIIVGAVEFETIADGMRAVYSLWTSEVDALVQSILRAAEPALMESLTKKRKRTATADLDFGGSP